MRNRSYFTTLSRNTSRSSNSTLWVDEVGDDLDARRAQLGTDVDEHQAAGEVGSCQRDVHRDPPAHRVAHDDGRLEALIFDERQRVGGHGVDGVVLVALHSESP